MAPINPKVTAASVGGALGGGAIATILIWVMQGVFGMADAQFTPERVVAITSVCGFFSAIAAGWFKKHGLNLHDGQ